MNQTYFDLYEFEINVVCILIATWIDFIDSMAFYGREIFLVDVWSVVPTWKSIYGLKTISGYYKLFNNSFEAFTVRVQSIWDDISNENPKNAMTKKKKKNFKRTGEYLKTQLNFIAISMCNYYVLTFDLRVHGKYSVN